MIQIRVRWDHPAHELLRGAVATLSAARGAKEVGLPAVVAQAGNLQFTVPEPPPPSLVLRVSVDVQLPAGKVIRRARPASQLGQFAVEDRWVEGRGPIPKTRVLQLEQHLTLDAGGTSYSPAWAGGAPRNHPLVTVHAASNARNALIDMEVHLEFLDVTQLFSLVAPDMLASGSEPRFGCSTVVLACTAGAPALWLVTIPASGRLVQGERHNVVVFYRPYVEPSPSLGAPFDWNRLARYLYAPVSSRTAKSHHDDELFRRFASDPDPLLKATEPDKLLPNFLYDSIRVGMEQALERAASTGRGLAGILVQPWPSELNFADAATSVLPRRLREILRLLWGTRLLEAPAQRLDAGRIVLAGYSAGGGGLLQALQANQAVAEVEEAWAFDTSAVFRAAPFMGTWLDAVPGRMVRATYGEVENGTYLEALRNRGEATGRGRVVVAPPAPSFWKVDTNVQPQPTWWGALIQDLHQWEPARAQAETEGRGTCRHAFAMFGGAGLPPSQGGGTFLEDFLRSSRLHVPR
jgi:hypothetical protein